jgi:membrane protease YdiL (CAAX protease family)
MTKTNSIQEIIFSILAIAFVFIFPHLGVAPDFTYAVPVLLFIWLYLKRSKENFADIGFSFKRFEKKAIWVGTLTGIILFCFLNYAFFPLLNKILHLPAAELSSFSAIRHNIPMYIFVLVMGWIIGGIYEEIVFHGFIFTRIEKMFGGKYATAISVLITGVIFGLYHIQLGAAGVSMHSSPGWVIS